MDDILAKASSQAMSFAIRSGISIASGFAIKTVSKLLDKIPESEKARIEAARAKLRSKISIVSTSIDLIRLEAARGNSMLEPTVQLVNELQAEIDLFDEKMVLVLEDTGSLKEKETIKYVEKSIMSLIESINDAVPLINLALITCGVSFTSAMSPKVSPSRLLQSSLYIYESNKAFTDKKLAANVAVGPVFELKLYTLFYNPSRLKYIDDDDNASVSTSGDLNKMLLAVSWKEEYARAQCKLVRTKGPVFQYQLEIEEDFDDGRYHDDDETPKKRVVKVADIRKQFFSASGHLLRLEGSNSPVLILKTAVVSGFEYIAFGETSGSDEAAESEESDESEASEGEGESDDEYEDARESETVRSRTLSLLEYLLRLASLQAIEQKSIFDISDEQLAFYLSNQADGSVVPKSKQQRAADDARSQNKSQALQLDSNIARLEHLSLGK